MLRASLRHAVGIATAPRPPLRFRQSSNIFQSSHVRMPDAYRSMASLPSSISFQDKATASPQQCRSLHTSSPLHARSSFRKIQDKLEKLKNDPNARNKLMGVGAAGYTVAKVSKFGAVAKFAFPLLKMTKVMPLMSMGLSTLFYSWFFGLPFAVGIVSLMASSQVARAGLLSKLGCDVKPVTMIPFFGFIGGGTGNTDHTKTEEYVLRDKPFERCLVALAPVAGMFAFTAAVPFGVGGIVMQSQCGLAVANTGFMMGMFSQLPMGDMTPGGQILSHFSKKALLLGTLVNAALIFVLHSPILILCLGLNLYRLYQRGFVLFGRQFGGSDEEPNYSSGFSVSTEVFTDRHKAIIASLYWAFFAANAGGMMLVGKSLLSPQALRIEQQQAMQEQGRSSHDPLSDNLGAEGSGWNLGDWALNNLSAVDELEKEDDFDREWRRQQEWAAQEARARPGELFR